MIGLVKCFVKFEESRLYKGILMRNLEYLE